MVAAPGPDPDTEVRPRVVPVLRLDVRNPRYLERAAGVAQRDLPRAERRRLREPDRARAHERGAAGPGIHRRGGREPGREHQEVPALSRRGGTARRQVRRDGRRRHRRWAGVAVDRVPAAGQLGSVAHVRPRRVRVRRRVPRGHRSARAGPQLRPDHDRPAARVLPRPRPRMRLAVRPHVREGAGRGRHRPGRSRRRTRRLLRDAGPAVRRTYVAVARSSRHPGRHADGDGAARGRGCRPRVLDRARLHGPVPAAVGRRLTDLRVAAGGAGFRLRGLERRLRDGRHDLQLWPARRHGRGRAVRAAGSGPGRGTRVGERHDHR